MRRTLSQVYRVPAALAAASVTGLLAALVSDGVGDVLAWLTLGGSVLIGVGFALRSRR